MDSSSRLLELETLLHVNSGDGKSSYARNSSVQRSVTGKARPEIENAVKVAYNTVSKSFPQKFVIADLGCGSGPNSLHAVSVIIDTIFSLCKEKEHIPPEILVFLNDLPRNDFNHVFSSLTNFYDLLKKEKESDIGHVFISGIPGSFYGRLFPTESVNIFHSSCSLHWLPQGQSHLVGLQPVDESHWDWERSHRQLWRRILQPLLSTATHVPKGVENNIGNIYISKRSPKNVYKAYMEEFEEAFTSFLRSRAQELLPKGQMVMTFIGRDTADPTTSDSVKFWDLLTAQLLQLSSQGVIKEADIDSINVPFYHPYCEEVKFIIEEEGSFEINSFKTLGHDWYPSESVEAQSCVFDKHTRGQKAAGCLRAVLEPFLASHFGKATIDELFAKYAKDVDEHLAMENTQYTILALSMSKKT